MSEEEHATIIDEPAAPATVEPTASLVKKPSIIRRFFGFWFNPLSKFGRFNRGLTRALAIILVCFAIGLAVGYYTLYRPSNKAFKASEANLAATNKELTGTKSDLEAAKNELSIVRGGLQQAQDDLKTAGSHVTLLQVTGSLVSARYYLEKDQIPEAVAAIQQARAGLDELLVFMSTRDAGLNQLSNEHLSLAEKEADRDIEAAQTEIEIVLTRLVDFEMIYFPK